MLVIELGQLQGLSAALGPSARSLSYESPDQPDSRRTGSDILDSDKYNMVLDKSNIVMLGPTGSGEYIDGSTTQVGYGCSRVTTICKSL